MKAHKGTENTAVMAVVVIKGGIGYSYLNQFQQGKIITPDLDLLPAASPRKSLSRWFANEKLVHNLLAFADIVFLYYC